MLGLAIVIFFLLLIFILLNELYKKTNFYINSRVDIQQFNQNYLKKYEIVNLGSTYSKYAFGAGKDLNINHGDFSLQSQSLEMDEKILLDHIDEIAENAVVVVVAAACLLLFREKSDNILYADVIKKHSFKLRIKNFINKRMPLVMHPRRVLKILFDEVYKRDVYDNFPMNLEEENSKIELENLNKVWTDLFGLIDLKHAELSKENLDIIDKNIKHMRNIVDICQKNNLRPVVMIPPFSDRLNAYFSLEFKEKIIMKSIKTALKGMDIPVLDYQYDNYFQKRYHLFADGGFRLNKMGSIIFLKRFFGDLSKYNIIINNETMGL